MLEEVGVELFFGQEEVGRHVVGDLDDFELDALGEKIGLHQVEQIGVGYGIGADLEGDGFLGALREKRRRDGGHDQRRRQGHYGIYLILAVHIEPPALRLCRLKGASGTVPGTACPHRGRAPSSFARQRLALMLRVTALPVIWMLSTRTMMASTAAIMMSVLNR